MGLSWPSRENLGQNIDLIGSYLGLPETGLSEKIAGGETMNSQNYINSAQAAEGNTTYEAPYNVGGQLGPGNYVGAVDFRNAQTSTPAPTGGGTGFDRFDRNTDPGDGWGWHGDDGGWKQGGGTDQNAENQRIRNEIGGAWDGYISSLDEQFGMLDNQKTGMEGQVNAQANKFSNTLGLQLGQGQTALAGERTETDASQKKNFQDLDEDQSNQMRAGNIFLGSRGAGDSSAADMYSYALGREGSKIRGDIMGQTKEIQNQIKVREENLQNIYNTEINNNQEELDNGLSQIATWFADSQRQIQQMKGEAGRDKGLSLAQMSYEILNQARARAEQLQDYAREKQTAVEQWALNNSRTLAEARNKLGNQSAYSAPGINRQQISGVSSAPRSTGYGTGAPATGYGTASNDENKNLLNMNLA